MKILITGGTGFIGRPLCRSLLGQGHELVVVSRRAATHEPQLNLSFVATVNETYGQSFDALINLAGEPIAEKRWGEQQKAKIIQSRIEATKALQQYCAQAATKPQVLISGSAIGYYGVGIDSDEVTEAHGSDESFSSEVCQRWEQAAQNIAEQGIRTCVLRTGIVLGPGGGALAKMLLPFKLGLGGPIGGGEQWMPWVHMDDMVTIIERCLADPALSGAINCTAPNPVTNREFSKILGRCLHRPAVIPMPGFVLSLALGQMAEELLLAGKKVIPTKLTDVGHRFRFTRLEAALADVLSS